MKTWVTITSGLALLGLLAYLERQFGWTSWVANLYRALFTRRTLQEEFSEQMEQP